MSLIRMFITTVYALAIAGEFQALKDYLALVTRVLDAKEAVIIPGAPVDKPIR